MPQGPTAWRYGQSKDVRDILEEMQSCARVFKDGAGVRKVDRGKEECSIHGQVLERKGA